MTCVSGMFHSHWFTRCFPFWFLNSLESTLLCNFFLYFALASITFIHGSCHLARDHRLVTFVKLKRFCPLSTPPPYPCNPPSVFNRQYKAGWNTNHTLDVEITLDVDSGNKDAAYIWLLTYSECWNTNYILIESWYNCI